MAQLTIGDRAPAFTLVDQSGSKVKLTDLKGRKVIVYFYPKADTPGCTTQSCELRDHLVDGSNERAAAQPTISDCRAAVDQVDRIWLPWQPSGAPPAQLGQQHGFRERDSGR